MGLFGSFSSKSTKDAARIAAQATETGRVMGNADIDQGLDTARTDYGRAGDLFGNLTTGYGAGSKLYADALGVNGAAGTDAARAAFTSSPGYTFNLDQGLQALQRTRAVNGTLASGNADTDTIKFASGLANQDYSNWLNALSGYDAKTLAATTGQAGTFGQMGNLSFQGGAAKAGINTGAARSVADGAMKIGEAQAKADHNKFGALLGIGNLFSRGVGALAGGGGLGGAFSIFGGGSDLGAGRDSDWV